MEVLGFETCVDHHGPGMARELARACPKGTDVCFENVGGAVFEAVSPLSNPFARIPLCGLISQCNESHPRQDADHLPQAMSTLLKQMSAWVTSGAIKYRKRLVEGLENSPEAFMGMIVGNSSGKVAVCASGDVL